MKSNKQTFAAKDKWKILEAVGNIKNVQPLAPSKSLDTLVYTLMDCPPNLKMEFIAKLRSKVGDEQFSMVMEELHYKKFEITINGLVKGKILDFEDKGCEFSLKDSKNVIFKGISKDSEDTLNKACDYLVKRLKNKDPLQLMTLLNKLVTSEFGQNILTKNSELITTYQNIREKIIQAVADALHARSAIIFNKITKEDLENITVDSAMDLYVCGLSCHIADIVLGHDHELDLRTLQLHDVIAVAEKLVMIGSFNAFLGIYVALSSTPIYRLKHTWEGLSLSDKDIFKKFELLMDLSGNKKALRNELCSMKERGVLIQPQLAIIKSDIIYAKDGNLDLEAYQNAIKPIISFCLDAKPNKYEEYYETYDLDVFTLTVKECNRRTQKLIEISRTLEPPKKDEVAVGSKIITNLTSSGNVLRIFAKKIYKQIPQNTRERSSSLLERSESLEMKIKQNKISFFQELLCTISQKENRQTNTTYKRYSEHPNMRETSRLRFHQRSKSLESTPENWFPTLNDK